MSVHLLQIATNVLLKDPTATLGDVAKAAGIGRTTLHKRFPTRQDLIVAIAETALDVIDDALSNTKPGDLEGLITTLIPLGPRVEFLLRFPGLERDGRIAARIEAMDKPALESIRRQQEAGVLRADLPAWWIGQAIYSGIYSAWESIAAGRLAPLDAPRLVLTTLLKGIAT